jgi:hypothetical protein
MLERVKAMGVPIIGFVSDKEKGLLPAAQAVFPEVPHQLCQFHFLKNCALAMKDDLTALGESVERRATVVQRIAKRLHDKGCDSLENKAPCAPLPHPPPADVVPPITEEELTAELCAMARHAGKASGRAPLNPPELVRHERLEAVRTTAAEAMKKKGATTRSSPPLRRH